MVIGASVSQAEARRFLSALGRRAAQSGNSFSVHQLFDLSDHLQLKVPDMRVFIEQLNDAGMLSCMRVKISCTVLICWLLCFVAAALMSPHMVCHNLQSCCILLSAEEQGGG